MTRHISDAEAERLADIFEHSRPGDYGPPRPGPAARKGRPSVSGGAGNSPRRGVRLSPAMEERYVRRAHREGLSVSELIREVLAGTRPPVRR